MGVSDRKRGVGERPFNTSEWIKKARGAENGRFQPPCSRSEVFDDPKIVERNWVVS
ncbi:MAG: hypothetical protein R6X34_08595 [Chloroflexota bacterium]